MLELVYRPGRVSCETLGNLGITDQGRSTDTREIGKSYKSELFLFFFFFFWRASLLANHCLQLSIYICDWYIYINSVAFS